jgi:hypothetical protein
MSPPREPSLAVSLLILPVLVVAFLLASLGRLVAWALGHVP